MSDDNVLTKEIAEQFLADNNSVDLSEFTAIENDAAEVLSGVVTSVFQDINKLAPVKLFEKFTDEMETLYHEAKEKQQDDVNDACFYIHHSGLNSHEAFIEFYNVLSDCLCFPLWVMDDQENERCDFFKGTQRHVMALLKQIANGD